MTKWEYLSIQLEPVQRKWDPVWFSKQLSYYGAQGWELVSCFCTEAQVFSAGHSGGTNGIFAVFKRIANEQTQQQAPYNPNQR